MTNSINEFVTSINTAIIEAIEIIDKNTMGVVYVCNEKTLVGSVTDGDIRRYILKCGTIEGTIQQVMNENPKKLFINDDVDAILKMKEWNISSIPIVDQDNEITNILFLNKRMDKKVDINVPVVIMAGGKGTRLYPYTQVLPKPLIPINDKTITELIMEKFEEFNCVKFSMIVNYKKEFIKAFFKEHEYPRDIRFYEEKDFLGTAGGLKLIEKDMDTTFFLNNCDVIIEEDYAKIMQYHRKNKNIITMVCALKKETFPYGTVETDEKGNLLCLKEKPSFEFLTNTGLYVIEPKFLQYIPENEFIHITDVIQKCIDLKENVGVFPICDEAWMDMGQIEELDKMRNKYR